MNSQARNELYRQGKQWILEAGAIIRNKINEPFSVTTKNGPNDLVTTIDKETEQYFAEKIKGTYPDHMLFGEEGYGDEITSLDGTVWIVDPIDGTMNFVHQKRNFAISIGIYQDGIGEIGLIYDVMLDHLYSAKRDEGAFKNDIQLEPLKEDVILEEAIIGLNHFWLCENSLVDSRIMQDLVKTVRGSRTYGSAALEFAYVAEGIIDGYFAMKLAPWDVAAGLIIVNEVAGTTTNKQGAKLNLLEDSSIVSSNEQLHNIFIEQFLNKEK